MFECSIPENNKNNSALTCQPHLAQRVQQLLLLEGQLGIEGTAVQTGGGRYVRHNGDLLVLGGLADAAPAVRVLAALLVILLHARIHGRGVGRNCSANLRDIPKTTKTYLVALHAGRTVLGKVPRHVSLRCGPEDDGRGATDVNSACVCVCEKINTVKPIEECRQMFGLLSVRAH